MFEVVSKGKVGFGELSKAVAGSVSGFLGDAGSAKANIMLLPDKWDEEKQVGIMRVNRKCVDDLRAALCMVTRIKDMKVVLRTVGISGILKKAGRFIV